MSILLRATRLIDGTGSPPINRAALLIEGARVSHVGSQEDISAPKEAQVIDLPDCTLLPGLMDVHIHISQPNIADFPTSAQARLARYEMTPEGRLLYTYKRARTMLEFGFTTIRDAGGGLASGRHITAMMVGLRDAIEAGIIPGPRIVVAGMTIVTNDHLSGFLGPPPGLREATADGPWELRKLAREHFRIGADYLKTTVSGGVGTEKETIRRRNLTQEELNAIVDEAHAFNKRVACHCHTPESIRMAVTAGVDTIEHCVYTDEDSVALVASQKKIVVPTLTHRRQEAIDAHIKAGSHESIITKMKMVKEICFESFRRYHEAGVKMACGTDSGFEPPTGQTAIELGLYVELGMTPLEAIQTATINAAEVIGREGDLGSLEPGKLADVIAVRGNPLDDIRILQDPKNVVLVMKEGKIAVDRRSAAPD